MSSIWLASTTLLPSHCVCGHNFTVEHPMSCPTGGFPSTRHNEIRDLTATETCHNVGIEPPLQSIKDEHFRHKTANSENGANPHAPSYCNKSPIQCYKLNEQEKKRAYEEKVKRN